MTEREKVQTLHPDEGKSAPRIEKDKYDLFRMAILRAVPKDDDGVLFKDLPRLVEENLPPEVRDTIGSITWYTTTIKLDLEARGLIERIPKARPQRLRKAQ